MRLKFILDFLKHRWIANNRHGTHSPFVYQLAEEVVYNFNSAIIYPEIILRNKNRLAKLIYRLAKQHHAKSILIIEDKESCSYEIFKHACPNSLIKNVNELFVIEKECFKNIDIAYINTQQNIFSIFNQIKKNSTENSLFIFNGIYKNNSVKKDWQKIKADNSVTISIDLFWLGLVYFKKGRVKANYKLKF